MEFDAKLASVRTAVETQLKSLEETSGLSRDQLVAQYLGDIWRNVPLLELNAPSWKLTIAEIGLRAYRDNASILASYEEIVDMEVTMTEAIKAEGIMPESLKEIRLTGSECILGIYTRMRALGFSHERLTR